MTESQTRQNRSRVGSQEKQSETSGATWYLTDMPGTVMRQYLLRKASPYSGAPITIDNGASIIWVFEEAVQTDLDFASGQWTGQITRIGDGNTQVIYVEVGTWNGSAFESSGSGYATFMQNTMAASLALSGHAFKVSRGQRFALRITGESGSGEPVCISTVSTNYVISPRTRRLAFLLPIVIVFALLLLMMLLISWFAPEPEGTPSAGTLTDGKGKGLLRGEWRFNTGLGTMVDDFSGWENRGTLGVTQTAPSWTSEGKFGSALQFDGDDDYVDFGHGHNLGIMRPLSIETWVKPASLPKEGESLPILSRSDSHRISYWLGIVGSGNSDRGTCSFCFWREDQNGMEYAIQSRTAPQIGKWYQVSAVDDGSKFHIFINGVLEETVPHHGLRAFESGSCDLKIGGSNEDVGVGRFFHGEIDQTRVFELDRTAASGGIGLNEISLTGNTKWIELYNSGDFPVDIKGWALFDNSGDRIVDLANKSLIIEPKSYYVMYENQYRNLSKLDEKDLIAAYDLDPDNHPTRSIAKDHRSIVDFVAWGASPGDDDTDAVLAGIWGNDDFVNSLGYDAVYLLTDGNGDEGVKDWGIEASKSATPAAPVPDVSASILFTVGTLVLTSAFWFRGRGYSISST